MRRVLVAALVAALAGCTPDPPAAEPTPTPTLTPIISGAPVSSPAEDLDPAPGVDELVVPVAADSIPAAWPEVFVIPYGPGDELLGTSQGGDSGGTVNYGPEYGAAGPDGTWWFLDAAKQRVARYDSDGTYLEQVKVTKALGRTGFAWSLPHALADGTLVALRLAPPYSWLLRVRDGVADEVRVTGLFSPVYDDGTLLYGSLGRGKYAAVDPTDGSRERVTTFRTPSGARFFVGNGFDNGRLRIELPDAGVSKFVPVRTASGALAHVGSQVVAGADGTIHVYLVGTGEDDESALLVGYTSVSPEGSVAQVEPLTDPFSGSDPGSAAQLVIAPGSSTPMLVYVLDDGVHVYAREG
jgi:hypothetical protein